MAASPRPAVDGVTRGLSWLLGIALLLASAVKLAGIDAVQETFIEWGLPGAAMLSVAALELAAGLLLFTPNGAHIGATLGSLVMGGAVATHLIAGEAGVAVLPGVMAGGLLWVSSLWRAPRYEPADEPVSPPSPAATGPQTQEIP